MKQEMKQEMIARYKYTHRVAREQASCTQGVAKVYPRCSQGLPKVLAYSLSMLRVCLHLGYSMGRVCLHYVFACLSLAPHVLIARASRAYRSCPTCLSLVPRLLIARAPLAYRLVVSLLLMMVVGVNGVKAQDYSGTYYIASNSSSTGYTDTPANNYYLCPTEGWIYYKPTNQWSEDGNAYPNPFLTTYKCRSNTYHSGDASNAMWTIERALAPNSDYYYIKHNKDGKYLVCNGQISETTNANRMRVHLEEVAIANLDDKSLFLISPYSDNKSIVFSPKSEDGWNYAKITINNEQTWTWLKWYTVNNGNKDYLVGNGSNGGPSGHTDTGGIIGLYTENDVNARFVFEEIIPCPVISYDSDNNQIEITHSGEDVTIYYTTDGTNPTTTNYAGTGTEITNITSSVTIKAIAVISQEECSLPIISPVAEIRVVPSANISFGSSPIVYNGSAQEPTVIVKDGETEIPSDEYTASYSNNTNAGNTATVTITDNEGGNYIVYGSTTFTILRKDLDSDNIDISVTKDEDAYDIVVKDGEETLIKGEDKDYTQDIETPAANQEVTITGVGNYNGTVTIKVLDFDAIGSESENAATYVATQNLATPTGLTTYIVTDVDLEHNTVVIEAVPYIPQNEPVLLLAETDFNGFQLKPYTGETTTISGNKLHMAEGTEEVGLAQVYVYYQGEFVLTMEGTLSEGKFYLNNPSYSTGAPSMAPLRIVKSHNTTEVKGIREHQANKDIWYSLDGRQLTGRPTEKGLYINNYHKVVVK